MSTASGLEWTFDTEAQNYEKNRPGYVPALYEDIFRYISINPSSNVAEIGIGGGQATGPILQTGCKLTAVEYGAHFTELCRQKFKAYPSFYAVTSKLEDFAYEQNAYDFVYSASAFHWIPEEIGYPKVFDMLKSGGAFARFANHPYKDKGSEDIHEALQKLYSVYMPGTHSADEYGEADAAKCADIAQKYGFVDIRYHLYHRTRTFTAREYTALLGTYSDHIAIKEPARTKFFSEIERVIDLSGGQITLYDTIDLQLARKP